MVADDDQWERALSFWRSWVLSWSSAIMEELQASVDGTLCEEHRLNAETREGGSSDYSDAKSTASLDAVGDRQEVAKAASSVDGDRTK